MACPHIIFFWVIFEVKIEESDAKIQQFNHIQVMVGDITIQLHMWQHPCTSVMGTSKSCFIELQTTKSPISMTIFDRLPRERKLSTLYSVSLIVVQLLVDIASKLDSLMSLGSKQLYRWNTTTVIAWEGLQKFKFFVRHGVPISTFFENYSKCLIWIFEFWRFPPIFVLVNLFDRKLQVFKNSPKWTIFGIFN